MKLGTIASEYKDFNIVIGATALPASSKDNAGQQAITLGTPVDGIKATTLDASQLRQGLGIEAVKPGTQAPARRRAAAPVRQVAEQPAEQSTEAAHEIRGVSAGGL